MSDDLQIPRSVTNYYTTTDLETLYSQYSEYTPDAIVKCMKMVVDRTNASIDDVMSGIMTTTDQSCEVPPETGSCVYQYVNEYGCCLGPVYDYLIGPYVGPLITDTAYGTSVSDQELDAHALKHNEYITKNGYEQYIMTYIHLGADADISNYYRSNSTTNPRSEYESMIDPNAARFLFGKSTHIGDEYGAFVKMYDKTLSTIIENTPLLTPANGSSVVRLYRGLGLEEPPTYADGLIFEYSGVISTSRVKAVAEKFQQYSFDMYSMMVEYIIPITPGTAGVGSECAGCNMLFVEKVDDSVTNEENEMEVILPKGVRYVILSTVEVDDSVGRQGSISYHRTVVVLPSR